MVKTGIISSSGHSQVGFNNLIGVEVDLFNLTHSKARMFYGMKHFTTGWILYFVILGICIPTRGFAMIQTLPFEELVIDEGSLLIDNLGSLYLGMVMMIGHPLKLP